MDDVREGYNAGWGLLDTPIGLSIAEQWNNRNNPDYVPTQPAPAAPSLAQTPSPMAPPDFSNAPSWWGKGNADIPQAPAQAAPQLPAYSPTPSGGGGRMIDYIGNVGGQTGITATSPLAAALRGATGGQNGQ